MIDLVNKFMKFLKILILCAFMFTFISGCNSENTAQLEEKVVINLPVDDSVNGYRISKPNNSSNEAPNIISGEDASVQTESNSSINKTASYCGNKSSKVLHKHNCTSVLNMKEENKVVSADRSALISKGYKPCGKCNP